MTRVAVTGGTGFVGANLVRRLITDGHRPDLLVRPGFDAWRIEAIRDRIAIHELDISDRDSVSAVMRAIQPAWVFHLAAHGAYSWQTDAAEMQKVNVAGTENLLSASTEVGVEAFVHTGSSSEYGRRDHAPAETEDARPETPYAATKAAATALCVDAARRSGARITTVRLYSAYGPFEDPRRLLPSLIVHGRRGVLPALVNPTTARDFVSVDDVVDACLIAAQHPGVEPGSIYNVGTGVQTTVAEAVDVARRVFALTSEPQWGSMPARVWDTDTWVADPRRIRDELGWRPKHTFESGFRQMAAWLEQHPDLRRRYEAAWP